MPEPAPDTPLATPALGGPASVRHDLLGDVAVHRETFWHNVVRETLMALAVAAGSGGRLAPTPSAAATSPDPVGDLFDGRMAVITRLGTRIPIADIYPLFACSAAGPTSERMLSADVQCTVFRIKTPDGEAFTLPVSEIAMVHSLSEELVARLEAAAAATMGNDDNASKLPFGFAAFTSLVRDARQAQGETEQEPTPPAKHPDGPPAPDPDPASE